MAKARLPLCRKTHESLNDARTYNQIDNAYGASRQRELSWSYASTEWMWYVWGGEAVIAEYAGGGDASVPLVWKKSYVYAGSRLLSTATNNGSGGDFIILTDWELSSSPTTLPTLYSRGIDFGQFSPANVFKKLAPDLF